MNWTANLPKREGFYFVKPKNFDGYHCVQLIYIAADLEHYAYDDTYKDYGLPHPLSFRKMLEDNNKDYGGTIFCGPLKMPRHVTKKTMCPEAA